LSATQFVTSAQNAGVIFQNEGLSDKAHAPIAEARLLTILQNALSAAVSEKYLPDANTKAAEEIVFKALSHAESKFSDPLNVDELIGETNVGYRTLLRAFQRYLKMGPKRYLKLRQLNLARRSLRQRLGSRGDVIAILAEHGVTEFGRFAAEYKYLFGEMPSETLQEVTR
jgi:AraC family ethanolamine operon transcriptional activator